MAVMVHIHQRLVLTVFGILTIVIHIYSIYMSVTYIYLIAYENKNENNFICLFSAEISSLCELFILLPILILSCFSC